MIAFRLIIVYELIKSYKYVENECNRGKVSNDRETQGKKR